MSTRLTLTMNGASLNEIRAWCDRAEKLGADPGAPVVVCDAQRRLAVPVSVRLTLLPPAGGPTPQTMKPAKRTRR